MNCNAWITNSGFSNDQDCPSIVEQVFDDPDIIGQGEYTAIYEFLLNPDLRDDADLIAGVLSEFSGWAQCMLERMWKRGLVHTTDE